MNTQDHLTNLPREIFYQVKDYLDPEKMFQLIKHWRNKTELEVLHFLLEINLVDPSYVCGEGWTLMTWACYDNNVDLVQLLLQRTNVDLRQTEKHWDMTPLHLCAFHNRKDILQVLVTRRPDLVDHTTLHQACTNNHEEICGILLPFMTVVDPSCYIPVCRHRNTNLFKLLMQYTDGFHVETRTKMTLLMYACLYRCPEIVSILVEYDDTNAQNLNGSTALMHTLDFRIRSYVPYLRHLQHAVLEETTIKILRILLKKGVDLEKKKIQNGMTALLVACGEQNHYECTRILLQHGANYQVQDDQGWNCLMHACQCDNYFMARMFLEEYQVDINQRNHAAETVLIMACRLKRLHIVDLLLDIQTIDLDAQDNLGNTALHWSCEGIVCPMMIRKLVKRGAKKEIRNYNQMKASDIALLNEVQVLELMT